MFNDSKFTVEGQCFFVDYANPGSMSSNGFMLIHLFVTTNESMSRVRANPESPIFLYI